jgi:hypothetical protein
MVHLQLCYAVTKEREMRVIIQFLLWVVLSLVACVSYALDKTGTGFFYPTGTANFDQKCGTWLSRDKANGGCYEDGYYHVGVDIMHPFDGDVYAVADGKIVATSYDDGSGNKWGLGNCALVVEHKKSDSSGVFVAVYGHLQCSSLKSDIVAGRSLGKIGHWKWGDHLHFAIHDGPYSTMAKSGWGKVPNSSWPSQNTFTDPIAFIRNNAPFDCGPSIRLCAQISSTRQVCWDTKNSVDRRCESGSDWIIYDNATKWRYPATQNVCSSTGCYRTSSILDFFIRPAYASLDGCVFQETGVGYGGSGPYPTPADPEEYGSPSSSDLPRLVSAGTSSSAPNLEATVVVEKSNKDEDPNGYLRVGNLYCGVKAKNTTSVSIGSFQNKCILYDGEKAGNDPPITLDSKTVSSLKGGEKTTTHHGFTIRDPGYYTLYGCVNTGSGPPKETKTSDNCRTKTFLAYSIPDVLVEGVYIQGGATEVLPGTTLAIPADFGNTGDDFHAGKNRRMGVTAELSGCVSTRIMDTTDIDEDVLRHGDGDRTKTFSLTVPLAARGVCTVTVIADPKGELLQTPNKEANRGNNQKAITFLVKEPEPVSPPEDPFVSCNAITQQNWISGGWSGLGYAPSFTGNGTQVLNAFCKRNDPHVLRIVVGDANNLQMISYTGGYVENKTTGEFVPRTLTCSGAINGGWCQGVSTVDVSGPDVDTTTATDPNQFVGATCEVVNAAWQCSGWRLGGGGL